MHTTAEMSLEPYLNGRVIAYDRGENTRNAESS